MPAADDASYRAYVMARRRGLVRTAYLLTGSWPDAEDAVQECLTKTYVAWRRIERRDTVDGYVRRTLTNVVIDRSRKPWRRETTVEVLPETSAVRADESLENRDLLMTALASVPPRQRAVLVLRYWEDLPVDQVAEMPTSHVATGAVVVGSDTSSVVESLPSRRLLPCRPWSQLTAKTSARPTNWTRMPSR